MQIGNVLVILGIKLALIYFVALLILLSDDINFRTVFKHHTLYTTLDIINER